MRRSVTTIILFIVAMASAGPPRVATAAADDELSDTIYNLYHPRLLFSLGDVPSLYAKVRDGGQDDAAYVYIRNRVDNVYSGQTLEQLLSDDFALEQLLNLGMATYLEAPYDTVSRDIGKDLTILIADSFAVDVDPYASSLRLRNLALGYDLFFAQATQAERRIVRDEVASYLDFMTNDPNYAIWHYRPYVSNKTAMVSAAMGLASIAMDVELARPVAAVARATADVYFNEWLSAHLENGGAYREGLTYGLWSMRHLIYYFEARWRFDGTDFSQTLGIRNMERWLAYELDPRGLGHTNNLQDCTDFYRPLSRHTTYLDWAQYKWGSQLASYIFLHGPGGFGIDMGDDADKAATVLWAQPLSPIDPTAVLPNSELWPERGLYYYRTGWPFLFNSDDVVFSFYSGEFRGGHAQEDQNQFTLTGYGEKFVTDHGAMNVAQQTESHNLILIDGAGQHNAGSSIGTDGEIPTYLLGDYWDYVVGDATQAYSTYSPYNANGNPFPDSDWSWGYQGANPVNIAQRKVVTVHEAETPPYFVIFDDIEKDGTMHSYQWRLHANEENTIDATSNPVHVIGDKGVMDLWVVNPCFDSLTVGTSYYDNGNLDDNSNLLTLTVDAVNPKFVNVLLPRGATQMAPVHSTVRSPGGTVTDIDWGGGYTDVIVSNANGCDVGAQMSQSAFSSLITDAEIAVARFFGTVLVRYMMTNGTTLWYDGIERARVDDGPASVSKSDNTIHLDRADAAFVVYSPQDVPVYFHDAVVPTTRLGSYLLSSATSSAPGGATPSLESVRAYPNPFNPDVQVVMTSTKASPAVADVYDVSGRHVARVWEGALFAGENRFVWDGRDARGTRVSSGVYFLQVRSSVGVRTIKLTVLK